MTHSYTCPWCETSHEVYFEPPTPGRNYGPPELCYEAYDGDLESPGKCPKCGEAWNEDDIWQECMDAIRDAKDAADEARAEARMEDRDWETAR